MFSYPAGHVDNFHCATSVFMISKFCYYRTTYYSVSLWTNITFRYSTLLGVCKKNTISIIVSMLYKWRIRSFRQRPLANRTVPLRALLFRLQTGRHTALSLIIVLLVGFETNTAASFLYTHLTHIPL